NETGGASWRSTKNRSAIRFVDDFRQLADDRKAINSSSASSERDATKASLAICREKTCGLMTGR
ncbi:hypothetical protein KPNIH23_21771, partial [Klebsiella pneumoniae subsp. pneumoniae KPNIH23]